MQDYNFHFFIISSNRSCDHPLDNPRSLLSPTDSCRIPEDSQDSILADVPANLLSPVGVSEDWRQSWGFSDRITVVCIILWTLKILFLGVTWHTCPKKTFSRIVITMLMALVSRKRHFAMIFMTPWVSDNLKLCTCCGLVLWRGDYLRLGPLFNQASAKSHTIWENMV